MTYDSRPSTPATCRLCGEAASTWFDTREWSIRRCQSCSFVQVHPQPRPEELAAIYGAAYFAKEKYGHEFSQSRELQRRIGLVSRFVPKGGRILDAGCATGDFVNFASTLYDCWGCDVSPYAIENAKVRFPHLSEKLVCTNLETSASIPGMFDAIVMWDVIEHIWSPLEVARSLLKIIRPGGHLIFSTPDVGSKSARLAKSRWPFMTPPEHLSFFSRRSAQHLFQKILDQEIVYWSSRGKWTSCGFVAYKLGRIISGPVVTMFNAVASGSLGRLPLYVPTGDVAYAVIRRR